nr:hypothetical protein [Odoribacter sp. OF09-27XD]
MRLFYTLQMCFVCREHEYHIFVFPGDFQCLTVAAASRFQLLPAFVQFTQAIV